MLQGDFSDILQKMETDSSYVEETRQLFLASPEMAQSMGISTDILNDPIEWAKFMSDTLQGALQGAESNLQMHSKKKRKFSRSE